MPLAPHLRLGDRWTFVGGKGGVGKTTIAAALAVELADAGESVTALSTDPAHSLGDALGVSLGPEPAPIPGVPSISALEVDGAYERERFLGEHGDAIAALLERGTYLDAADVQEVTGLAFPGVDELAALLRLLRTLDDPARRVVLDTAPTGHTLRLLQLPTQALGWLDALDAMEAKHAAVASALAGRYDPDEVTAFAADLRRDLVRVAETLANPELTRFVLVTTVEPVVLAEAKRYAEKLEELGVALAGIVVNRQVEPPRSSSIGERVVYVPELGVVSGSVADLRQVASSARAVPEVPPPPLEAADPGGRVQVGGPLEPPVGRHLYLVGGKGGVGKSTAAAALAVQLAGREAGRVLLLSVDPAGSLADVLGAPVDTTPAPVAGAPGVEAQQLDAEAAWSRFREEYEREVEDVFSGLTGSDLSAPYDREVIQRLIDLAPPGIDELMALVEVIDATEDAAYDALIVDTAPTGHFLRLLEMPGIALEWTHTLLRLLLKYRAVVGLGGLAERALELSRSLKSLRELLTDPDRTLILAVARPETLSVPETEDLFDRLRTLDLPAPWLLVNQALDGHRVAAPTEPMVARLIGIARDAPVGAAPTLSSGPVGVEALREFAATWRRVAM